MNKLTSLAAVSGAVLGLIGLCHCSSDDRDSFGDQPPNGFSDSGPPDAAATDAGPSCAATSLGADHRPLDLFIMIDKSGSMSGIPWQQAKTALDDFFMNPSGANISAALNYFPSDDGDYCQEEFYRLFAVPLGPLPANATPLAASLEANTPNGGTPLGSAIDGALYAAVGQKKLAPDHAVAMVIVTDGVPDGCTEDLTVTDSYVNAALLEEAVPTFAIGIGITPGAVLDGVAAAGGTGKSLTVADPSHLAEALSTAQNTVIGCEFVIPKLAPSGQQIDPTLCPPSTAASTTRPTACGFRATRVINSPPKRSMSAGWVKIPSATDPPANAAKSADRQPSVRIAAATARPEQYAPSILEPMNVSPAKYNGGRSPVSPYSPLRRNASFSRPCGTLE